MDVIGQPPPSLERPLRPTLGQAIIETVAKVCTVGFGATSLAAMASASQLWQYPYPRGLLLQICMAAGGMSIFATVALLALAAHRAMLIQYGPLLMRNFRLGVLSFAGLLLASTLVLNWPMFRDSAYALVKCGTHHEVMELCNRPVEKFDSEHARRSLDSALRKHLGVTRLTIDRFF